MNWQANVSHSDYREYGDSNNNNIWLRLEPGINLGAWRVRNLTTWNKSSSQSGNWESIYTRAERGLNNIKKSTSIGRKLYAIRCL